MIIAAANVELLNAMRQGKLRVSLGVRHENILRRDITELS